MADTDPYYSRKPVPKEFIEHVGWTGLGTTDELNARERKLSSTNVGDLRKFSNPKKDGKLDPFYQRKPVPDALIKGIGQTGLTKEEEFLNRERKFSVGGSDLRNFSTGTKSSYAPKDDPFYNRKPVHAVEIEGVGETGLSKAEEYEIRENKEALFDLSKDPFAMVTGKGHRASVSGPAVVAAAGEARRRSSVAPHHVADAHHSAHQSGYHGGSNLAPIDSKKEDEITPSHSSHTGSHVGGVHHTGPSTTTTTTTTTSTAVGSGAPATGHTNYYDSATRELAPHETE